MDTPEVSKRKVKIYVWKYDDGARGYAVRDKSEERSWLERQDYTSKRMIKQCLKKQEAADKEVREKKVEISGGLSSLIFRKQKEQKEQKEPQDETNMLAGMQAEAHRDGVVHPLHLRLVQPAHVLSQPPFVQGADLFQQHHRLLGQAAGVCRELNVGGQFGLAGLRGDGGGDDRGAVAVAGVVLHDEHRPHAPLLAAHHGAQVGIEDVSAFYAVVHKSSHSAGKIVTSVTRPQAYVTRSL